MADGESDPELFESRPCEEDHKGVVGTAATAEAQPEPQPEESKRQAPEVAPVVLTAPVPTEIQFASKEAAELDAENEAMLGKMSTEVRAFQNSAGSAEAADASLLQQMELIQQGSDDLDSQ